MFNGNWQVIPPEELLEYKPGEPVVVRTVSWRNGREEISLTPATFGSYSPFRGLVEVLPEERREYRLVTETVCETSVGRYGVEHSELHTDTSGYDE
jgi:hypothetical protein